MPLKIETFMFKVSARSDFHMAHRLMYHNGACQHLHGHTYNVTVEITGLASKNDMVIDFKDLKNELRALTGKLEHTTLLNGEDKPFIDALSLVSHPNRLLVINRLISSLKRVQGVDPTTEVLSMWFAQRMYVQLTDLGLKVSGVSAIVSESPTTSVQFSLCAPLNGKDERIVIEGMLSCRAR